MLRSRAQGVLFIVSIISVTAACAGAQPSQAVVPSAPTTAPSPTATQTPAPTATPEPTPEPTPSLDPLVPTLPGFDPARFSNPTVIDNVWMPFTPGTQWVTDGVTIEAGERIPHRILFTVTDLTKEIAGVRTVVVYVEDRSDGEVVEIELAFYAQDDDGTVWYFGEHPEEYEEGEFVAAPTWLAGFEEAQAGIKMVADPKVGMQTWYQGWAPKVEWSDYGRVDEVGLEDCVTTGCYDDVIRMAESSDDEEGIFQLKSYARGVGEIRVGWRGDAESREELQLYRLRHPTGAAWAKVRADTLALEKHAYEISPDIYGKTEPMQ